MKTFTKQWNSSNISKWVNLSNCLKGCSLLMRYPRDPLLNFVPFITETLQIQIHPNITDYDEWGSFIRIFERYRRNYSARCFRALKIITNLQFHTSQNWGSAIHNYPFSPRVSKSNYSKRELALKLYKAAFQISH